MAANASFLGPNRSDPGIAVRAEMEALKTATVGDLLYVGMGYRARIRQRTLAGVDVNGAPFAPYSTRGPYYFYPNRDSTSGRTAEGRKARATAAKGRHEKTGRIGIRTPTGIRYESYAAMKSALGRSGVDLYGAEQHTHMLDTLLVKAGGSESAFTASEAMLFNSGGQDEFAAFEANQPCTQLVLGFYGPEAERARGNNEGTSTVPKREFFALSQEDLEWGSKAIGTRMQIRARKAA